MVNLERTIIAQTEFTGPLRNKHNKIKLGTGEVDLPKTRQSRVVGFLDVETGDVGFIPAEKAKNIFPSDLPHLDRSQAGKVDLALQKPSLKTALGQKTSTPHRNMDEIWKARGGNPNYRPPKTKGFFLQRTPQEIREARRRKQKMQNTYQSHP